jgi:ABC-type phosphonate transport system ATPase subunit
MAPGCKFRDLRKRYGSVDILRSISLDVTAGEVIAIVGSRCSDNSTILRNTPLTPHPQSKNRNENIRHALTPPVLHQSPYPPSRALNRLGFPGTQGA